MWAGVWDAGFVGVACCGACAGEDEARLILWGGCGGWKSTEAVLYVGGRVRVWWFVGHGIERRRFFFFEGRAMYYKPHLNGDM